MTDVYQWHSVEDLIDGADVREDWSVSDAFRVEQFKPIDWTGAIFHNGVMIEEVEEVPQFNWRKPDTFMFMNVRDPHTPRAGDSWSVRVPISHPYSAGDVIASGAPIYPTRKWWQFWK